MPMYNLQKVYISYTSKIAKDRVLHPAIPQKKGRFTCKPTNRQINVIEFYDMKIITGSPVRPRRALPTGLQF